MGVLTNTIWKLKKNVYDPKSNVDTDWPSTCGTANIAYVNYHFGFSYEAVTTGTEVGWHINYITNNPTMSSTWAVSINASEEDYWYNGSENQWYYYNGTPYSKAPFIWITDGPDVDNYELYEWLDYNATLMKGPVSIEYGDDTVVTYADNDGYTLETAGKILADDITITVDYSQAMEEGNFTSNGTFYPQTSYGFDVVTVSVPTGSTINNQTKSVQMITDKGVTVTYDSGYTGLEKVTVTPTIATPAFKGGTLAVDSVSISGSGINAATSTVNNSGIGVSMGAEFEISRSSVLYNGVVGGWVNKSDGVEALPADSSQEQSNIETVYINSVTVPSGKTFEVTNNGTTNINGGLADKGIQVKSNKEVIVDNMTNFPVTYATTTVVNGITYSAGDLKVPVLNGTSLEFPSGFATPTTVTATVNGTVTMINGAEIKDTSSNIVRGSSSNYSTATYTSYLAKFSGTNTITTGPKVEVIETTPPSSTTGYKAGDIVFVV